MGAAGVLFAEGAAAPTGADWSNLTALGAVIAVLIFIVTKMLPQLHQQIVDQAKASSTALLESQSNFTTVLDKIHERWSSSSASATEELAKLREHCAASHAKEQSR